MFPFFIFYQNCYYSLQVLGSFMLCLLNIIALVDFSRLNKHSLISMLKLLLLQACKFIFFCEIQLIILH